MLHLWCESPEFILFQWDMDSGSALRLARNDDFDPFRGMPIIAKARVHIAWAFVFFGLCE